MQDQVILLDCTVYTELLYYNLISKKKKKKEKPTNPTKETTCLFTTEAPLCVFSSNVIHTTEVAMQNDIKTLQVQEVPQLNLPGLQKDV